MYQFKTFMDCFDLTKYLNENCKSNEMKTFEVVSIQYVAGNGENKNKHPWVLIYKES